MKDQVVHKLKKLGFLCQSCNFDCQQIYGDIGKEYIEANHLAPMSELKKVETRKLTKKDFVVLFSNRHRMIHKLKDASD